MTEQWRETFLAWADTDQFEAAVVRAEQTIGQALATHRKPYLAFSGGKDSTVMARLVLAQAPDIMVWHWDFGRAFVPAPLHEEVMDVARTLGIDEMTIETSIAYDEEFRPTKAIQVPALLWGVLPRLTAEGYDLGFIGLRSEESLKRKRRIKARASIGVVPECWPLASWRWQDVWAYLVSRGLPWVSLYDRVAPLVGYELARFACLFDGSFCFDATTVDNVVHWRWRNAMPVG